MDKTDIEALFCTFATPMVIWKETIPLAIRDLLCRHLWVALILGPLGEEAFWQTLEQLIPGNSSLVGEVQRFYEMEMKPLIRQDQLEDLRTRYRLSNPDR